MKKYKLQGYLTLQYINMKIKLKIRRGKDRRDFVFQFRTDLAVEDREFYREGKDGEVPGVEFKQYEKKNYSITKVKILNSQGEENMRKPKGNYITVEVPELKNSDDELKEEISFLISREIKSLFNINELTKTLIVGLGNWNVTPDALGPKVVEKIIVTRQYFVTYEKEKDEALSNVSAISPGVMGTTGIETGEIIKGIVEKTRPDLVIAIDALASRRMERVSTTIQISDTGINPGSGVGNMRIGLNKEYLGVPVIAIGVPTVVDAATMVNDTMNLIISSMKKEAKVGEEFYNLLENVSKEDKYNLIREVLEPYMPNVLVTPKEIDSLITNLSFVLSNGINLAVHHGLTFKDLNSYIS